MAYSMGMGKFRPPYLRNRLTDVDEIRTLEQPLETTHHAKIHFDPTMWVVSENTQFTTVTEKTIFGVHASPGNAETLISRETNQHSIAYSLSNIAARNYQDWLMCVEVIGCNMSVGSLRHNVAMTCSCV